MPDTATIALHDLTEVGRNLHRPECVLCTADGNVYVSDWGGGICQIAPDGLQTRVLARNSPIELRPNGIALLADGSFLATNLGDDGGVWSLACDGTIKPFLTEIDGTALPPSNYVLADASDRVWITVSTRCKPRHDALRPAFADGFIVLIDEKGPRIAASELGYTNEVQVHPSGDWLYVNETIAKRTSRMRIAQDGSLGPRETVTEYGYGTFPDGLYFDEAGGFLIVSIVSNRVIRVSPDGEHTLLIDDSNEEHLDWVETAFATSSMGREHFDHVESQRLKNVSSIAFGGPDRRLSYLGCLLDDRIVRFQAPVAGVKPAHWYWRMGSTS